MRQNEIKTVAVLGAGTMGNGIAHVFARAGYGVILRDIDQRFLGRALETISKNLDREIKKIKSAQPKNRPRWRASSRSPLCKLSPAPISPWKPCPSSSI